MNKPALGKRERTRQTIVMAAMRVIAQQGLAGTSIDHLMNEAGMARGTFYNYFQTREDVLEAVVAYLRLHLHERVESHIPNDQPPEVIVACMMFGLHQYAIDHPCIGRVMVRLASADNDWFSPYELKDEHFPVSDAALLALLRDESLFPISLTFIEGALNNLLRRTFQGQFDFSAIEQMSVMLLRGLNADEKNMKPAIEHAREFAKLIHSHADENFSS
jgi:AcrR family transcriptional regulator